MSKYPPGHHMSPENCRARGFKKGVSGNPKGKPPVIREVKELAKTYTEDAIASLANIMSNPKANASARVQAAVALLDRGWGRPKQSLEVEINHDASGLASALKAMAELQDRTATASPIVDAEVIAVDIVMVEKKPKDRQ